MVKDMKIYLTRKNKTKNALPIMRTQQQCDSSVVVVCPKSCCCVIISEDLRVVVRDFARNSNLRKNR